MLLILTHSICIMRTILLYNNLCLVIAHTMQISCGLITPNAVKKRIRQIRIQVGLDSGMQEKGKKLFSVMPLQQEND